MCEDTKKTKTFAKDKRALCEVRERARSSSRFERKEEC